MRNKITERNILIGLLAVFSGLLCLRSISAVFLYPLILFSMAVFVFAPFRVCLPALCFLMPFAGIIKISPGQISFFTVMFLAFVIRIVFRKGSLRRIFLISILLFVGYSFIFSGTEKIITIGTMACGFIMLHDACRSEEYNYKEVLYAFCFGLIVSSVLGLFKEQLPIINHFIQDTAHKIGHEEYAKRFVGLNYNPNYYSMDISVALSCLVVLMSKTKSGKLQMILFVVLSVFGFMSVSKSFLLVWFVLVVILLLYGFHNNGVTFFKFFILLIATAAFIYFFAKESVDTYIIRLTQDTGESLSDVTTGRTDIWISYLKATFKSEKVLLFGAGLGEILEKGTHNTYLECIYGLGIIGTAIYMFTLKMSLAIKNLPKNMVYYIPVLILLIRFMGIGVFVNDSLWYYLVIICLSLIDGTMIESNQMNCKQA